MEKEKKKLNLKIVIPVVVTITVIIVILVIILNVLNKQECERLEKEWTEKRAEVGDICVDMAYYAKIIERELSKSLVSNTSSIKPDKDHTSSDKLNELRDEFDKEIDEKMQHLEELYKTLGEEKTKAQTQWKEDYFVAFKMDEQREKIGTRIVGFGLLPNVDAVKGPCEELILIYARSDLRHDEIYSDNEETVRRFRDANVQKRYSEEIEQQTKQYIRDTYFGY